MNGKVVVDINVVIAIFESDQRILKRRKKAEIVFVPSIVVGELFYGAYHPTQIRKNVSRVEAFAGASDVLACDTETAHQYGQIKSQLRRQGRPLPDNDIWIAALAIQHGLTLVSRDRHFQEVTNLKVQVW
jgi:tRNA(fMet)-specific endonuclease VapC